MIGAHRNITSSYRTTSLSVQTRSPSQLSTASFGSQTSPNSVHSWGNMAGESQAFVTVPKYSGDTLSSKGLGEVKRLTYKELQEKKAKSLCFRCDDKWAIGHRCRKRELSVILVGEDVDEAIEDAGSEPPITPRRKLS